MNEIEKLMNEYWDVKITMEMKDYDHLSETREFL